jgi:FkbM family methyltransferase
LNSLWEGVKAAARTPSAFRNWPVVLLDIGASLVGRGPKDLECVTTRGSTIRCPNTPSSRTAAFEVFVDDVYRIDGLVSILPRNARVIDIGAHVGTFIIALCERHPSALVTAFEPSPTASAYLRRNIEANRFQSRVTLENVALSSAGGVLTFAEPSPASVAASTASGAGGRAMKVPSVSFQEVVNEIGEPIDLLNVDCEGAEYDIILNSSPESWVSISNIVLEYHGTPSLQWRDLADHLQLFGFVVRRHAPSRVSRGYGMAWLTKSGKDLRAREPA